MRSQRGPFVVGPPCPPIVFVETVFGGFQKSLQQLEDGTLISKTKKEIAQIKTVLNEFELGIRAEEGAK